VGRDVARIIDNNRKLLPRGSFFRIRGQLETMRTSYQGLLARLGFAIVPIYFLIVVNFQSWLDPFIIITALPAALAVAMANSILVVAFATERLASPSESDGPAAGRNIQTASGLAATRIGESGRILTSGVSDVDRVRRG